MEWELESSLNKASEHHYFILLRKRGNLLPNKPNNRNITNIVRIIQYHNMTAPYGSLADVHVARF